MYISMFSWCFSIYLIEKTSSISGKSCSSLSFNFSTFILKHLPKLNKNFRGLMYVAKEKIRF